LDKALTILEVKSEEGLNKIKKKLSLKVVIPDEKKQSTVTESIVL